MSKKHFKALAAALALARPAKSHCKGETYTQWLLDRSRVADVCQESNVNFNRSKFYSACEAGEEE